MNNIKVLFKKLSVVHFAVGFQKEMVIQETINKDLFVWNVKRLLRKDVQIPIQNILIF